MTGRRSHDDVPDARQCTMPGCGREKADPTENGGLCPEHERQVSGETSEDAAEDGNVSGQTPSPRGEETGTQDRDAGDVSKYRRVYLDAADRADRETWEFVEEDALREALDAIGFAGLLDGGDLFNVRGWRYVDVSNDGEGLRRRWYYPSENEPRPDEFRRFHQLLTEAAPEDYEPHYFRVAKAGKDPATQYGSWKTHEARLSVEEAVAWMEEGGNVGIAGRGGCQGCGGRASPYCPECEGERYDDNLVNVDIDDDEETTPDDVPGSLRARSRSRTGWHTWYFDEGEEPIPNIPTDDYGEVRTDWQYVVAPGSFVASTAEEIPDDADDPGYYTVEDEEPVSGVEYDDLPDVFHKAAEAAETEEENGEDNEDGEEEADTFDPEDAPDSGETSAVFDVDASDLVTESDASKRFGSIFHDSSTGANMSVSDGKLHCWRHGVAHGGLQALATLSDEVTKGCRELGKAHDNSGAGRNSLKGDWQLVWAAWHEAKDRGAIPSEDPIPYRALRGVAVRDDLVAEEDLVERETDDGSYIALPDAGAYNAALEHIREEYGLDPGREPVEGGAGSDTPPELDAADVLDSETTLDRREAWRAAEAVTPAHLTTPVGLDIDGGEWVCPACGEAVSDGVRALALADGALDCCSDPLDDAAAYDRLYAALRDEHGAPLPEYIPPTQAVEDYDRARGGAEALRGWDLLDGMDSEVTNDSPGGSDAVAAIDPAWEDSESGERIVLFDSGVFYCREHETPFWPLQLVALEHGLIESEDAYLRGDDWLRAYALARTEYGAPLPPIVWNDAEEAPEPLYLPVLPDSDDLLGEGVTTDGSALDAAREDVRDLYRNLAQSGENHLLTVLPALGKSYSAVVEAKEHPTLYAAERKELRKEAADRASEHGVGWMHVPTLGETRPPEAVLSAAVAHVREHGREALRDREALLDTVEDAYHAVDKDWPAYERVYGDEDDRDTTLPADEEDEEDTVRLDREACGCGNGEHGPEWHLATWTARKLGLKPRDIHVRGEAIFGATPPCSDPECPYTAAWDRATDPEAPINLLIGHPVHAYVDGARTQPYTDDGDVYIEDRAVVFDEFPGDAYTREFGDGVVQHARWLASCLDGRIEDTTDLLDHRDDLWTDEFVRAWLDGDGEPAVLEAIQANRRQAEDGDGEPAWAAVRDQLAEAPIYGDLRALVERAVDAADEDYAEAEGLLDAAVAALKGGRAGADALASGAEDGYAHPDAYWLLLAVLAPEDAESSATGADAGRCDIVTAGVRDAEHFTLGSDNGRIKAVSVGETHRILLDRDHAGADLLLPPDLAKNTVVGLDATGRAELWELALGARFNTADIHESAAERRAFLKDVLNLRVAQTTPHVHTYSGSPTSKSFGDDVALVEAVAEEYGGQQVAQDRLTTTTAPAVVTTKKVEDYLGSELQDAGAESVDHYGDLIGSNRLDEHSVGVILGAEHYGHDEAERWALLAGEEFQAEGHGIDLDYGSDAANALLRRMREDKVMQSIMRFGRDEEGAVVFAHTAALRDDLPVVAHGDVASAWTDAQAAVGEAAANLQGDRFKVEDVLADDRVTCSRRTVRRTLNRYADAGYLRVDRGHANQYATVEDPGTGEADLPDISTGVSGGPSVGRDSGQDGIENTNTWFVWSADVKRDATPRTAEETVTLGPPRRATTADPPD